MEAKATQALLNEVVTTLKEGQKGYADAMVDVKDADLKHTFMKYAAQRAGYITELEDQMFKLDLKPDTNEGSGVVAAAHRAFIDLKSLVTGHDRNAILDECERGEDHAKTVYETALKAHDLPAGVQAVLQHQAQGIKQAHDDIKSLRNAA